MKRTRIVLGLALLTGCAGIIGVPDLTLDESTTADASTDVGSALGDGSSVVPPRDGSAVVVSTDAQADADAGDAAPPNGCNADLTIDPSHCGRCGHSCGGGTCAASKCQPVTLADGLLGAEDIALDTSYVYYATYNDGIIRRTRKDATGQPEVQATGITDAVGVATDGTMLFFTGYDGLFRCEPGAACATTKKPVGNTSFNHGVTAFGGWVYWSGNGDFYRAFPDGGAIATIGSANQPWGLATDGVHVYYTSAEVGLGRFPVDGGGPTERVGPFNSAHGAAYVTIQGDAYFWAYVDYDTDAGYVYGSKRASTSALTPYGGNTQQPAGIAADAQFVYWTDAGSLSGAVSAGDGRLLSCPRAGCPDSGPTVLATGLRGGGMLVVDDLALYFVENNGFNDGGRIRKLAKP